MATTPSVALSLVLFLISLIAILSAYLYVKRRSRRRLEVAAADPTALLEPAGETALPSKPLSHLLNGIGEVEKEMGEDGKKKKRGRKKRSESQADGGCHESETEKEGEKGAVFSYPFSSYASATQRKIKIQYDDLVKSNQAKELTIDQVGQFVNCLVEARNELKQKSEVIQRSFKIKKALLFKADRSSFHRLCQQIYKLEAVHKRLEEDAAVYNLLQEQFKLSPAYKTMVEVGARIELKDAEDQAMEFSDISFEELLAREKKDSFWQRNGRLRSVAS